MNFFCRECGKTKEELSLIKGTLYCLDCWKEEMGEEEDSSERRKRGGWDLVSISLVILVVSLVVILLQAWGVFKFF